MASIGSLVAEISERLLHAGIDNARYEARMLLCHVLNVQTQILIAYPEREVDGHALEQLEKLVCRRVGREPMSHILGEREFWSLGFKVTRDTLTPRPDSETLIEAVLRQFNDTDAPLRVLDLGVGTGCLLLATLSEYEKATGLGVDASEAALNVACENAQSLGMASRCEFRLGNWSDGLQGTFDLVLSNPPYIPTGDRALLEPEVADFEPDSALFAGVDGLDDYRQLAICLPRLIKSGGYGVLEIGIGQCEDVSNLMKDAGFEVVETPKDLGGITRCVVIRKKL